MTVRTPAERADAINELRLELVRMARIDPGLVIAMVLDGLIEMASAGAGLGNATLQDMAKERFYGRVVRELLDRRRW